MKKFILLPLILTSFFSASSQNWQWATHYGSDGGVGVYGICLDDSGNTYMTGLYGYPYAIFGTDTLLSDNILNNIFISKTDYNGNLVWAKRTFNGQASGGDIKFDPYSNSIYYTSISVGMSNNYIYLNKINRNGNLISSISVNSSGGAESAKFTLDNFGNIYLLGRFSTTGSVGSNILSAGYFIAKFDATGSCIFSKKICNDIDVYAGYIKYSNSGIIISGLSQEDPVVIDTAHAINHGLIDDFISRFDTSGNIQWLRTIGGPAIDRGAAFDVDGSGNIFVSGTFIDTAYVDTVSLINNYPVSFHLSKWSNTGNLIWAKQMPGTSASPPDNFINCLSTNSSGSSYMTGSFLDTVDFGGGHILISLNPSDMFVVRYDSLGNCLGSENFGSANGNIIIENDNDEFYTTGEFYGTVLLGSTTLTSYSSNSIGDIYLAKHAAITDIEERPASDRRLFIYANPTLGKCNITIPDDFRNAKKLVLNIYDNTGKLIQQRKLEMHEGTIKLNLEAEAKGIYNVILSNGEKNYSGKIVFE